MPTWDRRAVSVGTNGRELQHCSYRMLALEAMQHDADISILIARACRKHASKPALPRCTDVRRSPCMWHCAGGRRWAGRQGRRWLRPPGWGVLSVPTSGPAALTLSRHHIMSALLVHCPPAIRCGQGRCLRGVALCMPAVLCAWQTRARPSTGRSVTRACCWRQGRLGARCPATLAWDSTPRRLRCTMSHTRARWCCSLLPYCKLEWAAAVRRRRWRQRRRRKWVVQGGMTWRRWRQWWLRRAGRSAPP